MVQLRDNVNGLELVIPATVGEEASDNNVSLNRYMVQRVADQLAVILETLKTAETHHPSRVLDLDQDSGDAILRSPRTCSLSGRQVEILCKVAEGMSNKEIAAQLHVSDQTIKNHMTNILHRLYANDRTHAVVLAFRLGLLDLKGRITR